jgi:hypothetical protein
MVLLDGLYPNGPIMALCHEYKWDFMMVLQNDCLASVWEEVYGLKELERANELRQEWGNRRQHFWWVNDIEYWYRPADSSREKKEIVHVVVCEESWEDLSKDSNEVVERHSFHAWISSKPLSRRNAQERRNLGARHRWGIEDGILVEKHHGYRYESRLAGLFIRLERHAGLSLSDALRACHQRLSTVFHGFGRSR